MSQRPRSNATLASKFAPLVLLAALAGACTPAPAPEPRVLARMGAACDANSDCGSKLCKHGACTKQCFSQDACPVGFDCGLAKAGDSVATCYRAQYAAPETGGFGTSCATVAGGCTDAATPCAEGFGCLAAAKCDANAYCTRGCETDYDCPAAFFCATSGTKDAPKKQCERRAPCSPCAVNDQCGEDAACTFDEKYESYCAKTCVSDGDCLQPFELSDGTGTTYPPFEVCVPDPASGGVTKVCAPAGGFCHGPSVLTPAQQDGQVCAGCRVGFPEDCAEGHGCYESPNGERYCTRGCTVDLVQQNGSYGIRGDTCPQGTYCFFGGGVPSGCGTGCRMNGICGADKSYRAPTCHPRPAP